jgi:hypothetical protein
MQIKKILFGLACIPFCLGYLIVFSELIISFRPSHRGEILFTLGLLIYPFLHFMVLKPTFIYTLGHEMTHIIWSIPFGASIKDVRIRRTGGFVNLSKTNSLIRLAPYFFPLFTVLTAMSALIVNPVYLPVVFLLVGATLSHHLISTFETLSVGQPDIKKTGAIFSLPIIFISNLVVVVLILNFVSPKDVKVLEFLIKGVLISLTFLTA